MPRLASVSLDLDDLWTYLRTRGDPAWESRPSYLPTFVPLALDLLDELDLRITFFVVGEDAARQVNVPHLRAIAERGHEIGNHSYAHETWLPLYSRTMIEADIALAEEAIGRATGQHPIGFRGPGYSWSAELLEVLAARHYRYDASTLPTFLAPIARLYFLARAGLSPEEQRRRKGLFGAFQDGFRPLRPYQWCLRSGSRLLEIPVTTMPFVRMPFHMSYLLYLSRISETLMFAYLRGAVAACLATGVQPSFLVHPLDMLGADQAPGLCFFPGMDLPGERKRELLSRVLALLGRSFQLVPVGQHANEILAGGHLRERAPAFA